MQPETPMNPYNTPTSFNAPEPTPKRRWPLSKAVTILLVIIISFILALMAILFLTKKNDSSKSNSNQSGSLEQNILTSAPGRVVSYNGAPVLQPCALVKPEDITNAGIKLESGLPGALERNQFDGLGKSPLPTGESISVPIGDKANECIYVFEGRKTLRLDVTQPNYAPGPIVRYEKGAYTAQPDIAGVKVYKKEDIKDNEKITDYIFEAAHAAVFAMFIVDNDAGNDAKRNGLVELIANRLKQSEATPTPLQEVKFSSKAIPETLDNCDVIDDEMFTAIMGVSPWPLMQELWTPSVTSVEYKELGKEFLYTKYQCKRLYQLDIDQTFSIRFEADTFQTLEGAKAQYNFMRHGEKAIRKNAEDITPTIGDESFIGDVARGDNVITFRKGRVIGSVNIYLSKILESKTGREERKQMILEPVRKAVEKNIGAFTE